MSKSPFNHPDALFNTARTQILHQDDALRALCVPLFYHLQLMHLHLTNAEITTKNKETITLPDGKVQLKNKTTALKKTPLIARAPIFITGKTGSGKTHLIKSLCSLAGVNFMVINATHLSSSGFKGMTLADVGEMLTSHAKSPLHAEFSVVFIDEFDKLFISGETSVRDWHRAIATELLTILEGSSDFPVKDKVGVPSRNMLFILGGSFTMHQDTNTPIGFTAKTDDYVTPDAPLSLTELGLPDELSGRIGKIISMADLDHTKLKDILISSPTSPYHALIGQLSLVHCTVQISDTLLDALIERQHDAIDKFGVRGLYQGFHELSVIQEVLADAPATPFHHYSIDIDGYTKDFRPPKITIKLVSTPKTEPAPTSTQDDDDMPF